MSEISDRELTDAEKLIERAAHAAVMVIRPEFNGDAEYWRLRAAVAAALEATLDNAGRSKPRRYPSGCIAARADASWIET